MIGGGLFPPGYREQVAASLVRLDAVLAELAAHAGQGWPASPARCTCLALDAGARSAAAEVLAALVVQWLTVQVSAAGGGEVPAVIVAGAEEVTRAHAERLADACELRGVPLTLLFRHLREDSAGLLGSGAAAFMRLGNHAEAEQAAGYLGRRHTFVVSSFTATRGGSQTSTAGGSDGYGSGESASDARTRGWSGGGFFGTGGGSSGGRTRTAGTSSSRNWSATWSQADGTSWTDAQAVQRVYEYKIEPSVLQDLPEYALLLADRSPGTLRLRAVECDPSIIALPGASTAPLPPGGTGYGGGVPPAATGAGGPAMGAPEQGEAGWQAPRPGDPQDARLSGGRPDAPWWQGPGGQV